jgi:hypothetical protein
MKGDTSGSAPFSQKQVLARDKPFDGTREPDYIPTWDYEDGTDGVIGPLRQTLNYERFRLSNWRVFRAHTGHWPLLSMVLHYTLIVTLAVGMALLMWVGNARDWEIARWLAIGGSAAIILFVVYIVGEPAARRLDWRLFGNRGSDA